MNHTEGELFYEHDLQGTLSNLGQKAVETIGDLPPEAVVPERETALFAKLKRDFVVNPLELQRDRISREGPREVGIELTGERAMLYGRDHVVVKGLELSVVVPFKGDPWLFEMRPSVWTPSFPQGTVVGQELRLRYRVIELDAEQLKQDHERRLNDIGSYIRRQEADIQSYNGRIVQRMESALARRRKDLQAASSFADALGIPERRKASAVSPSVQPTTRGRRAKRKRPKVFISYCKDDAAKAGELCTALDAAGADPWLDKRKLVLGDDWQREIEQAVAAADAVVVCLRPGFDDIGFRQKEVRWAIEALKLHPPGRGFIIPFIIEPCELPKWCTPFHAGGDLSKPTSLDQVIRAVEKHCNWTRSKN